METTQRTRYSIDIDGPHREQLAAIAKAYKLSQGEVIETLLDYAGEDDGIKPLFVAKREAKVAARKPKNALYQKFKGLTPAQLEAALKAAEQVKQ